MSLFKSNHVHCADSSTSTFKTAAAVTDRRAVLDTQCLQKKQRLKTSHLATMISLCLVSITAPLTAQAVDGTDIYINTTDQASSSSSTSAATASAASISDIGKNLEAGTYQSFPLHSITDPASGITIDDSYYIEVSDTLSLKQAQNLLQQVSPKLASNNAGIAASELQSQATQGLNRPSVFLRAGITHYDIDADVDLSDVKSSVGDGLSALNPLPNLPFDPIQGIGDRIPNSYDFERKDTTTSAGVAVLWPVYTGGRTQAVTELADARTDESEADALLDNDDLQTTLIDRYFTAQLAALASYLRDDALNTIRETDHMAQRLLDEGFISGVERLEARTALSEAESEAIKARHNAQLAMTALQRLLRSPTPIKPTTPLFVSSKPLPSLQYFQNLALQNHPGLKKVDAKYAQAVSLSHLSDAGSRPTISLFGYHEIDKDPSWIAGVSASWKVWGGINNSALQASGKAQMRQALLAKVDVSDNILLLVEKNWQSVENARVRYQSLNSNVELAKELLRYKKLGMQEGVNTALDVTTAQTKYLQARTEQAAAANDYVQALAALMQSIGSPQAFNEYMAVADIKLPTVY
ncbi:TolC family protein [Psychrobacter sp. FDAARGOS_221]|uniref:TolC family protein n=1 Tax=Psychrobacter sp. FDAARGOS_221 TaxID=1975705 RepID=UPI000BB5486B|nr:TolC family protein [Psychrobacter sp. FDAARGOS_221]PNK60103.1 TolC family protein [Psychrobacter sp. FDAARGOS_221]